MKMLKEIEMKLFSPGHCTVTEAYQTCGRFATRADAR
jgi:metal-dependent hydrolase (beta-lactamase superfamily II)